MSTRSQLFWLATAGAVCFGTPALAQGTVKIGELNSYKVFPSFLEPYKNGMTLALEEINAAGGVLGRKVELVRPRSAIGKNTVEALQSGALYGFAGQVDGLAHGLHGAGIGVGRDAVDLVVHVQAVKADVFGPLILIIVIAEQHVGLFAVALLAMALDALGQIGIKATREMFDTTLLAEV